MRVWSVVIGTSAIQIFEKPSYFQLDRCLFLAIFCASELIQKIYQFGLNPNHFWKGELPFPVQREQLRLRYSRFSIAVRVALVAAVAYFIWQLAK